MRSRAVRLATGAAGLLLLAGCFDQTAGQDAGPTSSARGGLIDGTCADLIVLGARGSTQDGNRNLGVGTEARRTVESLADRLGRRSGATTHVEPIAYDAAETSTLDEYLANVRAGADLLVERLEKRAQTCPDSRFALIGFSQGAQVVHTATGSIPDALTDRVAVVAMIADPTRDPADDLVHWTYGKRPAPNAGRLGAGASIRTDLRDRSISLCAVDDEICNDQGRPGGPPSQTHREFYESPSTADETAREIADLL